MLITLLVSSLVTYGLLFVLGVAFVVFTALAPPGRRGPALTGALLFCLGALMELIRSLTVHLAIIDLSQDGGALNLILNIAASLCLLGGPALLGAAVVKSVREGR
ncbi:MULTISPECIES: hypothetical protein [Nocardiopsis]|jgi:hypothetical protein|uniref:Uncharacterized protein n=2 Tax=Nocardiopsis alba TaxID=53437 RepID=A0A7K2IRF8_9ACTN|nr:MULTISPECIES: hypothetical protein [Nocardiopsis]AFR08893.1 putative membrane protein [Nocardiopsis alba ATCC BAA-2165]MEC3892502.1 hypothetical protein [Nocardiopsis sp. LDBS1602]MYR32569.1 hypothetical protein [Nocardiopsis alba]